MRARKPDTRAPDGALATCYRLIRKGGRIKFSGSWWADERLAKFEGDTVMVWPDYYFTELTVFADPDGVAFTVLPEKQSKS